MSDEKKDEKGNEPLRKIVNDGDATKSAKPNPPQKPPEGPCSGPTKLDSPERVIRDKECSQCRSASITQLSSRLELFWSC